MSTAARQAAGWPQAVHRARAWVSHSMTGRERITVSSSPVVNLVNRSQAATTARRPYRRLNQQKIAELSVLFEDWGLVLGAGR